MRNNKSSMEKVGPLLTHQNTEKIGKAAEEAISRLIDECEKKRGNMIILEEPKRKRKSSLEHQSTEQANETPEKKRRKDSKTAEEITLKRIQRIIDILSQQKNDIGINKLIKIRQFIDNNKLTTNAAYKHELEEFEKKLQEVGKAQLKELLSEANASDLTDKRKEEILKRIEDLHVKAKIEFPEYLVQFIPRNIIDEVVDITTERKNGQSPNSQLNSTTNGLASSSSFQR